MKSFNRHSADGSFLLVVQAVIGLTWTLAGVEKLFGKHGFDGGAGFANHLAPILGFFASKNPTAWYHNFLTAVAAPNAPAIGYLVAYGEAFAGVALLVATAALMVRPDGPLVRAARLVIIAALLAAILMNANYWLASGWISIADDRINVLMAMLEVVLAAASAAALVRPAASRAGAWSERGAAHRSWAPGTGR